MNNDVTVSYNPSPDVNGQLGKRFADRHYFFARLL